MSAGSLDRLLRARSVVIVGASEKPGALGNAVLRNLEQHNFGGEIYLVNPKRPVIEGRQALGGIDELPDDVDAAVLAIPAPAVVASLRALAARGVGAAVIFSAGFAEGGEGGAAAQAEIKHIADESDMVVLGPNCLGATSHVDGLPLTFVGASRNVAALPGVGIVSQSGAMAVVLGTMLQAKALAISVSVSTGNEAASGVEEYVDYLIDEPNTLAIAMVVEQFRAPSRFLAAARRARTVGKTVVLLHPGTSSAARASAATHTGALAGDWAVMSTLVGRAGVVIVNSLEELADALDLAVRCPRLGGGVAVLTESGAFKALTLDLAERLDIQLPELGFEASTALRAILPDFIPVSNPMDLTAQSLVDPDLYRKTLTPLLADPAIGVIVLAIIQTDQRTSRLKFEPIIAAVRDIAPVKPILFAGLDEGADVPTAYIEQLRSLGVPYFPTPDRLFRALARATAASTATPIPATLPDPVRLTPAPGTTPEYLAKRLLAQADIPFPAGSLATNMDEAVAIAKELGFPVALKAQAALLSHKSDAGGVLLGITDQEELREAWGMLMANMARSAANVTLDGVLIERMGKRGVELILGARNDPEWGPVLLVGFGGVQAEILKDVRLLAADLGKAEIEQQLRALKSGALLNGWRGSPALDVSGAAAIVEKLGAVIRGSPLISEIDLNPVIIYPEGQGAVALDALIASPSQHGW